MAVDSSEIMGLVRVWEDCITDLSDNNSKREKEAGIPADRFSVRALIEQSQCESQQTSFGAICISAAHGRTANAVIDASATGTKVTNNATSKTGHFVSELSIDVLYHTFFDLVGPCGFLFVTGV